MHTSLSFPVNLYFRDLHVLKLKFEMTVEHQTKYKPKEDCMAGVMISSCVAIQ